MSPATLVNASLPTASGFTLLEVILAVSILAVVSRSWRHRRAARRPPRLGSPGQRRARPPAGEPRAGRARASEALAGASAYRGRLGLSPERVVLFEEPEEVRFVTSAPPLTLDAPVAPFHAVVLGRKGQDTLRLIERLVPSDEPFAPGPERVLSRSVTRFTPRLPGRGRRLAGASGTRREAGGLPTAVQVELAVAGLARTTPRAGRAAADGEAGRQ